jgi:F-type H+-transporting ATPase subunit b
MRRVRAFLGFASIVVLFAFSNPDGARATEEVERQAHDEAEDVEHGGHGQGHHDAHINWAYGFAGEKEGVEPDLVWRPVGMPPPVLANIINAGLLFFVLFKFGKAPVAEGLRKRKARIVAGMNEAGKMKREAHESLELYEEKLKRIDEEIERVRTEMREAADVERKRILADAKERRERMEREARVLIEQEMKAAREALIRETARSAIASAEEILTKQVTAQDHDWLAKEYVDVFATFRAGARGDHA